MKKELTINDILRFIGCKIYIDLENIKGIGTIEYVEYEKIYISGFPIYLWLEIEDINNSCKLILKDLSTADNEYLSQFVKTDGKINKIITAIDNGQIIFTVDYKFSFHKPIHYAKIQDIDKLTDDFFDVRGWIEEGIAIKYDTDKHNKCYEVTE